MPTTGAAELGSEAGDGFEQLLEHLEQARGFDFTGYKRPSLVRRVDARMQRIGIVGYDDYRDYLELHPDEFMALFDSILIGVTGFFRDPPTWEFLRREVVPAIVRAKPDDAPIRIWSAACASGEEAYSLAVLLVEALGESQFRDRVKIYATDVDDRALAEARNGSYSPKRVEGVPAEIVERHFERTESAYVFRRDLRRSIIFGHHDLIQDAPISRIDLLVCRNTLIYFNAETQARILTRFNFALNDGGYLFLGKAEMLLTHGDLFTPKELKRRVFVKVATPERPVLSAASMSGRATDLSAQDEARRAAFDVSPLAQMVVDVDGLLADANEEARSRFGISSRDVGRPFHDLEVSYRPVELRSWIRQAYADRQAVRLKDVEVALPTAGTGWLDIDVVPLLAENGTPLGATLSFSDVTRSRLLQNELQHANRELEAAYEELQSTNEELETTNEELQSTVEELETTNEELQSTNEELETLNEELHSTNDELRTANDTLRDRTGDLDRLNVFLESVLGSIRAGVVVVDHDLRVQAWNGKAENLWGLRAEEVTAQHFLDLDIGLPVAELRTAIRDALAGDGGQELVLDAVNRRGRQVRCRVNVNTLPHAGDRPPGAILVMDEVGHD